MIKRILKKIIDELLMISIFPELFYKILFNFKMLLETVDNLSKYAKWVADFVDKEV